MNRLLLITIFSGQYLCMLAATVAFASHQFYPFLFLALLAYAFPYGLGRLIKLGKTYEEAAQASPPRWSDMAFKYAARTFIVIFALYGMRLVISDLWPTLGYSLFVVTCGIRDSYLVRYYVKNPPSEADYA